MISSDPSQATRNGTPKASSGVLQVGVTVQQIIGDLDELDRDVSAMHWSAGRIDRAPVK